MRKRPRILSVESLSATANSSASVIMIGTCTKKKMQVLVSARMKTGSLRQADDVGEAAEMEIQALADLEAHPQRPQDRIDQEEAEQDERRRDEEPAVDLRAAIEPCGLPLVASPSRRSAGRAVYADSGRPAGRRRLKPRAAAPTRSDAARPREIKGTGLLPFPDTYWICDLA